MSNPWIVYLKFDRARLWILVVAILLVFDGVVSLLLLGAVTPQLSVLAMMEYYRRSQLEN